MKFKRLISFCTFLSFAYLVLIPNFTTYQTNADEPFSISAVANPQSVTVGEETPVSVDIRLDNIPTGSDNVVSGLQAVQFAVYYDKSKISFDIDGVVDYVGWDEDETTDYLAQEAIDKEIEYGMASSGDDLAFNISTGTDSKGDYLQVMWTTALFNQDGPDEDTLPDSVAYLNGSGVLITFNGVVAADAAVGDCEFVVAPAPSIDYGENGEIFDSEIFAFAAISSDSNPELVKYTPEIKNGILNIAEGETTTTTEETTTTTTAKTTTTTNGTTTTTITSTPEGTTTTLETTTTTTSTSEGTTTTLQTTTTIWETTTTTTTYATWGPPTTTTTTNGTPTTTTSTSTSTTTTSTSTSTTTTSTTSTTTSTSVTTTTGGIPEKIQIKTGYLQTWGDLDLNGTINTTDIIRALKVMGNGGWIFTNPDGSTEDWSTPGSYGLDESGNPIMGYPAVNANCVQNDKFVWITQTSPTVGTDDLSYVIFLCFLTPEQLGLAEDTDESWTQEEMPIRASEYSGDWNSATQTGWNPDSKECWEYYNEKLGWNVDISEIFD